MKRLRKLGRWLAVIAVILAFPALYIGVGCRGGAGGASEIPFLPEPVRTALNAVPNYQFPEEKSYLTFPEWYIVYSSQDYAAHIARERPSSFAYLTTATEFWTSYCRVNRIVSSRYAFNLGTQVMIYVIGVSHSAEFLVKGLYENTVGRIFEALAPAQPVAEEVFAQQFAQDYGTSLNTTPWYDYDFIGKLSSLWESVPASGDGLLRKWERRLALSGELLFKGGYGWLIGGGSEAVYAPAQLEIRAVLKGSSADVASADARIRIEKDFGDGHVLAVIPRYQPFTDIARVLAQKPVQFIEVGGNHRMLVTVRVPAQWAAGNGLPEALFTVDVLAPGGGARVGYDVSVAEVLSFVKQAEAAGAVVEHLYDY